MKMQTVIFTLYLFTTISVGQSEKIMCKARPGCQLAKCDPGIPSLRLNTNEYPLTCVTTNAEYEDLKEQLQNVQTELKETKSLLAELKLNTTRAAKAATEWEEMKPIFAELKRKATEARESPAEAACRLQGGLPHSGKCFTVPHVTSSGDMTHDQARKECAKYEALLAEVHDRNQQDDLYNFAVTKMPGYSKFVQIWSGMEYQHSTSTLLYRSGKVLGSSQLKWFPSYPHQGPPLTYLVTTLRRDDSPNVGLFNTVAVSRRHGVMCEKDI